MSKPTLFEAVGGQAGVLRLAHAWHKRVLADEIVSHAFSHGFHPQHTERLAAYWSEAWGGPPAYTGSFGTESSVVRMHSGNGEHKEMDQRAIRCFEAALQDVAIDDAELRHCLVSYFVWATHESMAAYPHSASDVPRELQMPRWSWNGRVNVSE
ncbi:oxidoreductase [Pelomonas sp. HMWF004]|nr:oxidoreductase [Pelomonas sp. HMWF004]